MEKANKKNQPLIIVLMVVIILILLSFIPATAKIGSYVLKPVDMFSDVKPDSVN